jgi:hypothetical protein
MNISSMLHVLRCAGNIGIDQPDFFRFQDVQLDCNGVEPYAGNVVTELHKSK